MNKKFESQELDLVIYKEKPTLVPKGETIPNLLKEGKLGMLWFVYQGNLEEYIRQFKNNSVYLINQYHDSLRERHKEGVEISEDIELYEEEGRDTSFLENPDDYYIKEEELDPILEQFREILYSIQAINFSKIDNETRLSCLRNWFKLGLDESNTSSEMAGELLKNCFLKPERKFGGDLRNFINYESDYNDDEILPSFYGLYGGDPRVVCLEADLDYKTSQEEVCIHSGLFMGLLSGIFKSKEKYYIYVAENKLLLNRDWDVQIYGQNKNALTIKSIAFFPWMRSDFLFDLAKGLVPGWKLIPTKGNIKTNNREVGDLASIAYRGENTCDKNYRLAAPYDLQFLTKDKECTIEGKQAWEWYKEENKKYPGLYYGEYNKK